MWWPASHGARKPDFQPGHPAVGAAGRFVCLGQSGYQRSALLSRLAMASGPGSVLSCASFGFEAVVRRRKKHILLVTTLLRSGRLPRGGNSNRPLCPALALELAPCHLKTTMGMEWLRCQSPDMASKRNFHGLLGRLQPYSLPDGSVPRPRQGGTGPFELSRRGSMPCANILRTSPPTISAATPAQVNYGNIYSEPSPVYLLPLRPGRQEPRAVKRRPKAYQLLQ